MVVGQGRRLAAGAGQRRKRCDPDQPLLYVGLCVERHLCQVSSAVGAQRVWATTAIPAIQFMLSCFGFGSDAETPSAHSAHTRMREAVVLRNILITRACKSGSCSFHLRPHIITLAEPRTYVYTLSYALIAIHKPLPTFTWSCTSSEMHFNKCIRRAISPCLSLKCPRVQASYCSTATVIGKHALRHPLVQMQNPGQRGTPHKPIWRHGWVTTDNAKNLAYQGTHKPFADGLWSWMCCHRASFLT